MSSLFLISNDDMEVYMVDGMVVYMVDSTGMVDNMGNMDIVGMDKTCYLKSYRESLLKTEIQMETSNSSFVFTIC